MDFIETDSHDVSAPTIDVWHQRLNHVATDQIKTFVSKEQVKGIVINPSSGPNKTNTNSCSGCALGQMKSRGKTSGRTNKATEKFERIHSDVITDGGMGTNGYRYIVTFTDEFTRKVKSFFIKSKNETFEKFKLYKARVENRYRGNIKELQADGGGEYVNKNFCDLLKRHGILICTSNADEPRQNGLAERVCQSVYNAAITSMKHSKKTVPPSMTVHNMLPSAVLDGRSPNEMDTGVKSNLSSLRTFGCEA